MIACYPWIATTLFFNFENRLDTVEGLFSVNLGTFHRRSFQMHIRLVGLGLGLATLLELLIHTISRWILACWNKRNETIFLPLSFKRFHLPRYFAVYHSMRWKTSLYTAFERFTLYLRKLCASILRFWLLEQTTAILNLRTIFFRFRGINNNEINKLSKDGITIKGICLLYKWKTFRWLGWKRILLRENC